MDYLYDHDDVESLGFGINSCDYDGLDYEDRRDRISTDLAKLGLSFSDVFNSLDIIGDERATRMDFITPRIADVNIETYHGRTEQPALRKPVFGQAITINLDERHTIGASIKYIELYSSRIELVGVKFYQPESTNRILLDILNTFKDGEQVLGRYSSVEDAIISIGRWVRSHAADIRWRPILWQDLVQYTTTCDTFTRTYIFRVISLDNQIYDVGISDSRSTYIATTKNITKFVKSIATDINEFRRFIRQSPPIRIAMQSYYEMLLSGMDEPSNIDILEGITNVSYDNMYSADMISFIEKYWYLPTDEYDSTVNDAGYQVRVYIDECLKIHACAVMHKNRFIYYVDDIDIYLYSSKLTTNNLNEALSHIRDPILASVLGNTPHWTKHARTGELHDHIAQQTGWDIHCKVIRFCDKNYSLKVTTRNCAILIASLYSPDGVINVRPFIASVNEGKHPIVTALHERAFQDAIINYATSDHKSLEAPVYYFKTHSETVDEFNKALQGYKFFEYGEDVLRTDKYKLRLYYKTARWYANVNAISIVGADEEVLYCQKNIPTTSIGNTTTNQAYAECWEGFLSMLNRTGNARVSVAFRTIARVFNSSDWQLEGAHDSMSVDSVQQQDDTPELFKLGYEVIGLEGVYKILRIVTDTHMYIAKVLVTKDHFFKPPVITVIDLYAKKDYSRRYIDLLANVTFRNFDDIYQVITEKIDPIITNQYKF